MDNDLLLLLIGAAAGFISTVVVELIRQRLEKRRKRNEWVHETSQARDQNIKDFLETDEMYRKAPLAWVKLVESESSILHKRDTRTDSPGPPSFIYRLFHGTREYYVRNLLNGKYILGRTQIIGRQEKCEISLDDPSVSRLHAMIRFDDGEFMIYDLGSTAGTLVNDSHVPNTGRSLVNGDKITVGKSVFLFEETQAGAKKRKSGGKGRQQDADITKKNNTGKAKGNEKRSAR